MKQDEKVILSSFGDITRRYRRNDMLAQGILTVRGGMTSHAAVVARGMGTCVCMQDVEISNVTEDEQDISH